MGGKGREGIGSIVAQMSCEGSRVGQIEQGKRGQTLSYTKKTGKQKQDGINLPLGIILSSCNCPRRLWKNVASQSRVAAGIATSSSAPFVHQSIKTTRVSRVSPILLSLDDIQIAILPFIPCAKQDKVILHRNTTPKSTFKGVLEHHIPRLLVQNDKRTTTTRNGDQAA